MPTIRQLIKTGFEPAPINGGYGLNENVELGNYRSDIGIECRGRDIRRISPCQGRDYWVYMGSGKKCLSVHLTSPSIWALVILFIALFYVDFYGSQLFSGTQLSYLSCKLFEEKQYFKSLRTCGSLFQRLPLLHTCPRGNLSISHEAHLSNTRAHPLFLPTFQ